jgi:hypothetical protein
MKNSISNDTIKAKRKKERVSCTHAHSKKKEKVNNNGRSFHLTLTNANFSCATPKLASVDVVENIELLSKYSEDYIGCSTFENSLRQHQLMYHYS